MSQPNVNSWKDTRTSNQIIYKHLVKKKKVLSNSQHESAKNESHWIKLIFFFDRVTGPIDREETADAIYWDFTKAFATVSNDILFSKVRKYNKKIYFMVGTQIVEKSHSQSYHSQTQKEFWRGLFWIQYYSIFLLIISKMA